MARVVLIILAGLVLAFSGCRDQSDTGPGSVSDRIGEALQAGRPSLVNFSDETCYPCRKMKPILEQAKKDYSGRATILSVDIRENRDLPQKYQLQLVPTQIFFDESGREAGRHVGFMDRTEIDRNLQALGVR